MKYIQEVKLYNIEAVKLFAGDIARAIGVPEPDYATAAIIKDVGEASKKCANRANACCLISPTWHRTTVAC